jgi:hypothetical protein
VRCGLRLIITSGVLAVAATAWSASDSPGRCAAIKAKGTGIGLAAGLACQAAGTRTGRGPSSKCLAGAAGKLRRLFAKADAKGSCGAPGDAATIADSVAAFTAEVAAGVFPGGSPDDARRCAAKKMLRAGVYGRARLACWGRAFAAGGTVDSQCFGGAGSKLLTGFTAAEKKPGCVTTGGVTAVEDSVDGFVDGVASSVRSSSTTTTVVSASTTSTEPGATPTTTVVGAPQPTSTTTSSTPGPAPVSFSADVQPIFTANCALAGCHTGPTPEEGLDLSAGRSYARLVNVDSRECGQFKRVRPGRPDASYILFKLAGPPQPCFSGERMPRNAPPLPASDQDTIRTWIAQDAPNN